MQWVCRNNELCKRTVMCKGMVIYGIHLHVVENVSPRLIFESHSTRRVLLNQVDRGPKPEPEPKLRASEGPREKLRTQIYSFSIFFTVEKTVSKYEHL